MPGNVRQKLKAPVIQILPFVNEDEIKKAVRQGRFAAVLKDPIADRGEVGSHPPRAIGLQSGVIGIDAPNGVARGDPKIKMTTLENQTQVCQT